MKKLLFVLSVILLVGVGCNSSTTTQPITQVTPTPQQQVPQTPPTPSLTNLPNGWKTYTNTSLGYSVSYPSDWTFKEDNGPGNKYSLFPTNGPFAYEGRGDTFNFDAPQELTQYL